MIRYLLPKEGQFYKANLHCHSTKSDGRHTPEQLKADYKAHGYSVLAITDHEYLLDHSDMSEPDFLMINGYEAYVKETNEHGYGRFLKTAHLNLIAKTPDVRKQVCVDPVYIKYATRDMPVEDLPRVGEMCARTYDPGTVNRLIKQANENGFLVFYNHPSWSRENPTDVMQYRGLIGMEVFNYGVNVYEGYPGDDAKVYDTLLRAGERLYAFANDDNHNKMPADDPLYDSYGGFNMIKAQTLDYASIIGAIERGEFYCSTGPEIHALYMEDDTVHVSFSDAREVYLITEGRAFAPGRYSHQAAREGEVLHEAQFKILPADGYFRLEVVDACGKKAYTRAYFMDELGM